MKPVRHPAPYSDALIPEMVDMLGPYRYYITAPLLMGPPAVPDGLYDPMAGSGKIDKIASSMGARWWGSELEPEFIPEEMRDRIMVGDCRNFTGLARCVVTSPAYGNRMADQYLGTPLEQAERAKTGKLPRRRSYAISLGRKLTEGNGAALQWGEEYEALHRSIFEHIVNVNIEPWRGLLLLNVSSHYRAGVYEPVSEWYLRLILSLKMVLVDYRFVSTPGFRDGQNRESRVGGEHLFLFEKVVPR